MMADVLPTDLRFLTPAGRRLRRSRNDSSRPGTLRITPFATARWYLTSRSMPSGRLHLLLRDVSPLTHSLLLYKRPRFLQGIRLSSTPGRGRLPLISCPRSEDNDRAASLFPPMFSPRKVCSASL